MTPKEKAEVQRFVRLINKGAALTESEQAFMRRYNALRSFTMIRDASGRKCYANPEQYEAAQAHREQAETIREMYEPAQAGKKIAAARVKGTQSNSAKAAEKARLFRAEFKRVAADQACVKWSREAQIDEAIRRMKRQKIHVGKRRAYDYLSPRK